MTAAAGLLEVGSALIHLTRLSDVVSEPVHWLWPGRIPYGKLTILEGDPGVGKSQVALDVAARVTVGSTMPTGEKVERSDVVLLTAEDGLADTVRPRFDAAGGDPTRLHILEGVWKPDNDQESPPSLPADVARLREAVEETGSRLVIIDPLTAYLGERTNTWRDHDVRCALAPLARLAEETGAAIVGIMHLNKATERSAMYRGGGSIAFHAAARSVFLAASDPKGPDLRILAAVKVNLGPKPASLQYRLVASGQVSRVDWQGVSEHDAETLLDEYTGAPERRRKREDAKEFVREALSGGPRSRGEVLSRGKGAGFSERTLERVFKELRGISDKGFGEAAVWQLPPNPANSPYMDVGGIGGEEAL